MRKWNQACWCGRRLPTKKLRLSNSRLNWLSSRLIVPLHLPNQLASFTTSILSQVKILLRTISTQQMPHYVMLTFSSLSWLYAGHNGSIALWIWIQCSYSFKSATGLAMSLVFILQNPFGGRWKRKTLISFGWRYSTHAIWKFFPQHYLFGR